LSKKSVHKDILAIKPGEHKNISRVKLVLQFLRALSLSAQVALALFIVLVVLATVFLL